MAGPNGLSQAVVQNPWETLKGPLSHPRPSGSSSRLSGGFSWQEENPARPPMTRHGVRGSGTQLDQPVSAPFKPRSPLTSCLSSGTWPWGKSFPSRTLQASQDLELLQPPSRLLGRRGNATQHPFRVTHHLPPSSPPRPLSRTSSRVVPLPEGGLRRRTPELAARSSSLGSKCNFPNTCTWAPLT